MVELVKYRHNLQDIPTCHIKSILNGETNHKVLLLLDGYDEYSRGTNHDIDKAIESKLGNCFIILTSRPGLDFVGNDVRSRMDGEVVIEGFSVKSIVQCTVQYFQDDDDDETVVLVIKFLCQAINSRATVLLHVPILLLMCCVVFQEKESLPSSKTELYSAIYTVIMDRTTLKKLGSTSEELERVNDWICTLGKFSWETLKKNNLLLNKVLSSSRIH